jgi:hypothetical protein
LVEVPLHAVTGMHSIEATPSALFTGIHVVPAPHAVPSQGSAQ